MTDNRLHLLVAQLGARMHYAVPRVFWREGMLHKLVTDIAAESCGFSRLVDPFPTTWLPRKLRRLRERRIEDVPRDHVESCVRLAIRYGVALARARSEEDRTRAHLRAGDELGDCVARMGLGRANAVYGFNSASHRLFEYAKRRGAACVLEQTIAPRAFERQVLDGEHNRWSGWEEREEDAGLDAFCAREAAEWEGADMIVCGSEFVKDSIAHSGGPYDKCHVVPYGVDSTLTVTPVPREGKLRALFLGTVCLRKGAPYIWEVARQLCTEPVRFRVVGPVRLLPAGAARLADVAELTGSVPRTQVGRELAAADVLVLPSLVEGSATVCYEALAAGIPVVTTPNAGSVVRDGVDGYVVPAGDADALAGRLAELAHDPARVREMGQNARDRAKEYTVTAYGARLISTVRSALTCMVN